MRIYFNQQFFHKKTFSQESIEKYLANALRDLHIATKNKDPEVVFTFTYATLIKAGITLIAKLGYKVSSKAGHHIKILEKLAQILEDENVNIVGQTMRKKRNADLYKGGIIVSSKEVKSYLGFVKKIVRKVEKIVKN